MANTKIPVELSSTPGIVDNSNATAITIDSSENIFLSNTTSLIGVNTSDGSDNKSVMVNGGGAASSSRGAYVWLKGNEHSSNPGFLQLTSGSVSGAAITMITNGSERARITNDGLTFNGDTAAANALDDYEEGTWSPVVNIAGHGDIGRISSLYKGRYQKVGSVVHFQLYTRYDFSVVSVSDRSSGVTITLPFAQGNGSQQYNAIYISYLSQFLSTNVTNVGGFTLSGSASLTIKTEDYSAGESNATISGNSNAGVMLAGFYYTYDV